MENALAEHLVKATKVIEDQLDAEIEKMEKMDEDDFEVRCSYKKLKLMEHA